MLSTSSIVACFVTQNYIQDVHHFIVNIKQHNQVSVQDICKCYHTFKASLKFFLDFVRHEVGRSSGNVHSIIVPVPWCFSTYTLREDEENGSEISIQNLYTQPSLLSRKC